MASPDWSGSVRWTGHMLFHTCKYWVSPFALCTEQSGGDTDKNDGAIPDLIHFRLVGHYRCRTGSHDIEKFSVSLTMVDSI